MVAFYRPHRVEHASSHRSAMRRRSRGNDRDHSAKEIPLTITRGRRKRNRGAKIRRGRNRARASPPSKFRNQFDFLHSAASPLGVEPALPPPPRATVTRKPFTARRKIHSNLREESAEDETRGADRSRIHARTARIAGSRSTVSVRITGWQPAMNGGPAAQSYKDCPD